MDEIERDLKELIIASLRLEDVSVADLDSDEELFADGLGLDSIDALELGIAIRKRYGIKIENVTDEVRVHFRTVASLARFIEAERGKDDDAVA